MFGKRNRISRYICTLSCEMSEMPKIFPKHFFFLLLRSGNLYVKKKGAVSSFQQWGISMQLLMSLVCVPLFYVQYDRRICSSLLCFCDLSFFAITIAIMINVGPKHILLPWSRQIYADHLYSRQGHTWI